MALPLLNTARSKAVFLGVFLAASMFQSVTTCPELAMLGSTYDITSFIEGENYTGAAWVRPFDGQNVVICGPLSSCTGVPGYSAVASASQSTLTIANVKLVDVGNWTITGNTNSSGDVITSACELTAAQQPTCSITSDLDTNDLVEGDSLMLSVAINGYYCTRQHSFNLTTGIVTDIMYEQESETGIVNRVINNTFKITDSHFGDVRLKFVCEDSEWDLTCSGVDVLKERIPTTTPPTTTTTETTELPTSETSLSQDTSSSLGTSSTAEPTGSPSGSTGSPGITGSTNTALVEDPEGTNYALIGGIIGGVVALILLVSILLYTSRRRIRNAYKKYIVNKDKRNPNFTSSDAELQRPDNSVNANGNAATHNASLEPDA